MSDVSALIAQSLNRSAPQKQVELAQSAAEKRDYLGAAARASGSTVLQPGTPLTVNDLINQSLAASQYYGDRRAVRSEVDSYKDTAISVGSGFVNSLAGIGALGVGMLNPEAGVRTTNAIKGMNSWIQDQQSAGLAARRRAYGANNEVDLTENAVKFSEDVKTNGSFVASLKRVGRDALDGVSNATEDGMIFSDGIANAGGSLLAAGPLSKVARAAGVSTGAAVPVSIGAMEAGGAYSDAVQEAKGLGATDLKANAAGLIAAAIQGPAGAATGSLVSKFEAAPLAARAFREIPGNVLRETVEEGIQSATGQIATNIALRDKVDAERSLTEGVGDQAALGALYGSTSAGAVQVPGAAIRLPVDAAVAAGRALVSRGEAILGRQKAEEAAQATSAQDTAVAGAASSLEGLRATVAERAGEQAPVLQDYLVNLYEKAKFDPVETENEASVVRSAVEGATDRFSALRQVSAASLDPELSAEDRLEAAAYLVREVAKYQGLINEDLRDAILQIDEADPEYLGTLSKYEAAVLELENHPLIREAVANAQAATSVDEIRSRFSDEALATPEGVETAQKTAGAVLDLAFADPGKVDPETLDTIRKQVTAKRLNLSDGQKAILDGAYAYIRETQNLLESKKALGLSYTDKVTQESQTRDEKGASQIVKKSATEHARGVFSALRVGNRDLAVMRLGEFMLFAKHMQNKVDALNRSMVSGKNEPYEALSPKEGRPWFLYKEGVGLQLGKLGSVQFAQQTALDARAIVALANGVAAAFPDLGVQPVAPVALEIDPDLKRKASDIVDEYLKGRNTPTQSESNTQDKKVGPSEVTKPTVAEAPVEVTAPEKISETVETPTQEAPVQTEQPSERVTEKAPVPETVVAEPEVVSEVAPEKAPYEELYETAEGSNWFKKAYRLPKTVRSKLVQLGDSALSAISNALGSPDKFTEFVGRKVRHTLNQEVLEGYSDLISSIGSKVSVSMAARLEAFVGEKSERIQSGERFRDPEGKVLNIARMVDGKIVYDPVLLEGAVLAGIQWLLDTRLRPRRELDADRLGKILGVPADAVTQDQLDEFNDSIWLPDAVQQLAQKIISYWGVDPLSSAPKGISEGIAEAVAKEVLVSLEDAQMIENFRIDELGKIIPENRKLNDDSTKSFSRVKIIESELVEELLDSLKGFPSAIDQLVLVDPPETRFIGEPPKSVAAFQQGNRLVRNSPQVRKAIEQRQNTPHRIDVPMVSFLEGLGRDLVVELFGNGNLENSKLNVNHKRSLEGQNRTLTGAYDTLVNMLAELRSIAANEGKDPSEVPIYYAYNVTKVGRLQMQGSNNPQSNKLMREAVLPTRVSLDLNNAENQAKFMLAVAQAWGVKVHKQPRALSIQEAYKKARENLAPAIKILADFQDNGTVPSKKAVAVLRQAFGTDLSPVAVHAAMDFARFAAGKDLSNFSTSLYVEADGVTDGPINALMHLSTGAFSARWLELMGKGGLFFDKVGQTVNAFVYGNDVPAENKVDLYEATTQALVGILGKTRRQLRDENPDVGVLMDVLLTAMDSLFGKDFTFDGETLIVGRNIAKNPLTVTIYGSGAAGIAGKVAGAMTEAFYQELSKKALGEPNQADDLENLFNILTNIQLVRRKGEVSVQDISQDTAAAKGEGSPSEYTFSSDQLKNLKANIQALFVEPMQAAIEENMGDTLDGRELVQRATQIQSIVLKHQFLDLVETRLKERLEADPKFRRSDFLSENDLTEIYKTLEASSPLIKSGGQILFVAGSESTDLPTVEYSRNLSGQMSTAARIYGPEDARVAGIPFVVISAGDGQMMLNLFTGEQVPQGALDVFDGVHLKLDTLTQDAETVNRAVYEAWRVNPLASVNESYQAFLANTTIDLNNAALVKDLKAGLRLKAADDLSNEIAHTGTQLAQKALFSEARHRALGRVSASVDHMASIEAPYQSPGESLEGRSLDEIAERLNELAREEYLKLRDGPKPAEAPAQVQETVTEPSEPLVLSGLGLRRYVNGLKVSAELKNLLKEAVRALGNDWKVVQGTEAQTAAFARANGQVPVVGENGETILGYMSLKQKQIYLNTADPETLLHELLHATTTQKILEHYLGNTTPEIREAVSQLEELMSQWMGLEADLSGMSAEQRQAYSNALRQIRAELSDPNRIEGENKAAALDEFLAWNLSNQELIRIAQRTRVQNPIARILKSVLISLKNLIWGRKMAPMVRTDMYSSLRFNASVLINATPTLQTRINKIIRHQSVAYGQNSRLQRLHDLLARKIYAVINEQANPVNWLASQAQVLGIQKLLADRVSEAFIRNGFPMTPQEHAAFTMFLTTFATEARFDQAALARVQELFTHVNKTLRVEDFMADPTSQNPNDYYQAQLKFSVLKGIDYPTGNPISQTDPLGRSTLLSAFLALAMVNEPFREVLSKMELPKGERLPGDTLDNRLTNLGTGVFEALSRRLSGEGKRVDILAAIDVLTDKLAETVDNHENIVSQIANPLSAGLNKLNDGAVSILQKSSKSGIEKLDAVKQQTSNRAAQAVLDVGKGILAVVNESEAKLLAEGWISTANRLKLFKPAHDMLNDLIGRTEGNAEVFDLIKRVRSMVQQMRQQFREHLPGLIAERFTRNLESREWTALFRGLGKTDLAALRNSYTVEQILDLISDPGLRSGEIRRLEAALQREAGAVNTPLILDKARQLAVFMNTGVPGQHLLRNATAVANLFGVPGSTTYAPSARQVDNVDHLTTLYALEGLDPSTLSTVESLVRDERKGMSFTLSYLIGQRVAEQSKVSSPIARANHYKGYIPSLAASGAQLRVLNDSNQAKMRSLGYTRIGDYQGSQAEFGAPSRGYYFAPIASRALFNQGIMQNIRQTASGVDPVTGHTHDGVMIAGRITEPTKVARMARSRATGGDPLMPIFDDAGKVIAYERSVDPAQQTVLEHDTHLARMIGVWRGRQAEESLAGEFNELLVEALHKIWLRDKADGREEEFYNLSDPVELAKDPVIKDAVGLFTPEARQHIESLFGGDGFRVRRDMLNDAIGYRSASVGDFWTGNTRLPPGAADTAKKLAIGVFGANAYKYLVTAEKLTQNLVSEARQLIVVKSVVVPVSNFIANIYQLAARGVNLGRIARDIPKKLNEVNVYVKRRQEEIRLEAELRAAENNLTERRRVLAELQTLRDANKRMSIWPLIQAGEFSSISEAGSLEKEETTLFEGRLSDFIETQVNKLPEGVRTAGRYALITQDTALFQGMRRAMEYGDFLAKAIRYDHLVQEKKISPDEALASIGEEFVNYDRLSGRFRTWAENMGLLWFWNFKVRIAKIAVTTIRENPVHALLTSLVPTPEFVGSIGTPLEDNIFSITADGDLGWSVGPGMGLRSWEMNPWVALVN